MIIVLQLNFTIFCIVLMTPHDQIMPWGPSGLVCSCGTDVDLAQKCYVYPKLRPNKLPVCCTKVSITV